MSMSTSTSTSKGTSTTITFEEELSRSAARFLHFGMTYGDFREAAAPPGTWDGWSQRVRAQAERYQSMAEGAFGEGRVHTAVDGWTRAAAYHHFAQLRVMDRGRKLELQRRSREAYARAAPHLSPSAFEVGVPFSGTELRGYLRMAKVGAPCVLLLNGLDSAKEVELAGFAEGFLRRGCSVFYFDGPGQGALSGEVSLSLFEGAVSAIIDLLSSDEWLGPVRFGVFGVSFGGYLACRTAAREPRIQACLSLGGFHDGSVFSRLPPHALDLLRRGYRLAPDVPLANLAGAVTLEGTRGHLRCPLLLVHGTADHLVDQDQVRRMAAWAAPVLAEIWNLEGAEHVCTDRFGDLLPRVWDWMAGRLARAD
jgi:2,6-dihydroxypseudooxynicotine hydrolase